MFKHLLLLFTVLFIGIVSTLSAQVSRQILVVSPGAQASYLKEDYNKLQTAIHTFRQRYGLSVQGYDPTVAGYVVFSSKTKLSSIPTTEIETLKSNILEVFPQSVFSIKTQTAPVHTPKEGKQSSTKKIKN